MTSPRPAKGVGGRRACLRAQADVREHQALRDGFETGIAEIGPDIVLANAGIARTALREPREVWRDVIDVILIRSCCNDELPDAGPAPGPRPSEGTAADLKMPRGVGRVGLEPTTGGL